MIVETHILCDGCPTVFVLAGAEQPEHVNMFQGAGPDFRALMTILDVDSLVFCSAECMNRVGRAVLYQDLAAELKDPVAELLRGVGLSVQIAADKAAALQQPDPMPVEEPCQRVSRPEVLAARSDLPVTPLGEPAARPNQPEPADAELTF